jgi:hypothetical protein
MTNRRRSTADSVRSALCLPLLSNLASSTTWRVRGKALIEGVQEVAGQEASGAGTGTGTGVGGQRGDGSPHGRCSHTGAVCWCASLSSRYVSRSAPHGLGGIERAALMPTHTGAGLAGRGRGERGRRRGGNRGGYAGGGWSRGGSAPPAHMMPYPTAPPSTTAHHYGHGQGGEYTPLQRPSHLVDHVMSNPSYGGVGHNPGYQQPPLMSYGGPSPYGGPYGPPHALPMPIGTAGVPAQPQPMALPMPHAMPQQPYPGGPPIYPPGAQAQGSWQNQFYASPHHHNPSSS